MNETASKLKNACGFFLWVIGNSIFFTIKDLRVVKGVVEFKNNKFS
jgi:hypothetical protein